MTTSAQTLAGSESVKLRRWPPHQLLRNDRSRVKMATLLSKRYFALPELAELTQQPVESCLNFINLLKSFDLLAVQEHALNEFPQTFIPTLLIEKKHGHGLIRSIRRRLRFAW
jgi:hypothetical protein